MMLNQRPLQKSHKIECYKLEWVRVIVFGLQSNDVAEGKNWILQCLWMQFDKYYYKNRVI